MVSPRFCFGLGSRLAALVVATVATIGAVCGCGGNGGAGATAPSAAVSSTPRSAGGLAFTASADHAVYSKTDLITLTYSITSQTADNPVVSTTGGATGGWFNADAVNGSQTINLIPGPSGPGGGAAGGFDVERFPLFFFRNRVLPGKGPGCGPPARKVANNLLAVRLDSRRHGHGEPSIRHKPGNHHCVEAARRRVTAARGSGAHWRLSSFRARRRTLPGVPAGTGGHNRGRRGHRTRRRCAAV